MAGRSMRRAGELVEIGAAIRAAVANTRIYSPDDFGRHRHPAEGETDS